MTTMQGGYHNDEGLSKVEAVTQTEPHKGMVQEQVEQQPKRQPWPTTTTMNMKKLQDNGFGWP
jgi:hypothetical protein